MLSFLLDQLEDLPASPLNLPRANITAPFGLLGTYNRQDVYGFLRNLGFLFANFK